MNRYHWPACLLSSVLCAPPAVANPLELRVGTPFPIDLLLPSIEDGQPSAPDLFLGKKTLVVIFASW